MKKFLLIFIPVLLIVLALFYWFYTRSANPTTSTDLPSNTFNPLNRPGVGPSATASPSSNPSTGISTQPTGVTEGKLPILRHLSTTPIGGFMASTTASTTLVRFVDRGIGHVYEAKSDEGAIIKISNTTIPKVYESYWNKNLTAAVFRYIKEAGGDITNFYAELRKVATSSDTSSENIPYEIKGKFITPSISEIAVSPKGDRVFTLSIENGGSVGYVSQFDESKKTKVFESPLTQLNVEWPEENTVAISTKASGVSSGYVYLLDLKRTSTSKALGDLKGLSAKVSADAKKIFYSTTGARGFSTGLYIAKDGSTQDLVFRTTADKCVWSKKHVNDIYCAVPTDIPAGTYPDSWYRGNVSFVDQIWHLDTGTGEVHLIANLTKLGNDLIDAVDLKLDPSENFLYFINKRDLTLWSLDLTQ
jgi:hypothetical protein